MMNSSRNDNYQAGSLRIRVTGSGADRKYELVRYNGRTWDLAENNSDRALQADMQAAVGDRGPGLYVPPPLIGMNGDLPLKAA
jgi:hypothetical protein